MHTSSQLYTLLTKVSLALLLFSASVSPLKADIVFNFVGNHAIHGKARAELRLKDNYRFGSEITARNLIKFRFTSSAYKFSIYPKEILSIYAGLKINGRLANSAGNYQFYINAKNNKYFAVRTNGTWRAKSDPNEGNLGRWRLRTKGFKRICLRHDRFHKAAGRGDLAYVNQCLRSGVSINTKEGNGWTALHSAASNGRIRVARALLRRGARKSIKDIFGRTARDYARRAKKYDMVSILDSSN